MLYVRFFNFILAFFLLGTASLAAPVSCESLFQESAASSLPSQKLSLDELKEQFTKTFKALRKVESNQVDKANVYATQLISLAKQLFGLQGISYTVDPHDPLILLIDPIKSQKGQKTAPLNSFAYAHTQVFKIHGMAENDYAHPLRLEYNPKMLFLEGAKALYSDPRGRLSLSHEHILGMRYDDIMAHEDTHAQFFYKEMSGAENHLQGFIMKSPHLKTISNGYQHDFHFDELAAYSRQVIFSLQSGKPKAEIKTQTQVGIELAQSLLHQDLTSFVNKDLTAINSKSKGWITKRIRKSFWGEVRPGILVSNTKSLSKIFIFEAPLVELANSAKAGLTAMQIEKVEAKKSIYFVMDLKFHYVVMRMQGPLSYEKMPELLNRLAEKLTGLRATAKAVKEGMLLVQQNLDRRNTNGALEAALALKPFVQVLNDSTEVVASPL